MAEALVSFGVQKLLELLSGESERLQGVHQQVDDLKLQLSLLQSLLKDADARKYENDRVRTFLEDVKYIVYDAEDIIESFILNGNGKGIKWHLKRLFCFLIDRWYLASDIQGITKKISDVVTKMKNFGIQERIYGDPTQSMNDRQKKMREIRQTFDNSSERVLVGVDQSVEELVGHLVKNDNIQVVSISGMGGIGKTTLAQLVFQEDAVRRHFDGGFAWVCVSQEFTQKDIWRRILQALRPNDRDTKMMDEQELHRILSQLLKTSRCLVVLDDVWKNDDWDRIKAVFPKEKGSKMLLTSRNEGVGLHVDPNCFAFKPKTLTSEESWKLFESMLPMRDETDEELEATGKKMVRYCGGLPLAIKALGGLLANKENTVEEWKRVCDNIQSQIVRKSGLDDNNLNSVYQVLSLSYEDLSMELKHCFLYLAHFPEDDKIYVEKLSYYWAAEGVITPSNDGATIVESGEEYIEELARRNMIVIVRRRDTTGMFDYCQMHDMMRELCLTKAKEENFVQVIKVSTSTSTIDAHTPARSRRLVVHGGDALHLLGSKNNQKARSVLFFGLESNLWKQSAEGFRNLQLLRVLDLSEAEFEGGRIPCSIGKLIHLRYLSLYVTRVSHLPSSLRNLKLLLYLNLRIFSKLHVPNIFKEMVDLRFLWLPSVSDEKTKLELGNLVNLEYLICFQSQLNNVTDLLRMTRLRTLVLYLSRTENSEVVQSSLRELRNLERLDLVDMDSDQMYNMDFVRDFIHLKELGLRMLMPQLPDHSRFPPHLAHIFLSGCKMEEDPMPILEKLLHLKSVELSDGAFVGKKMVCSEGGFPQLCKLDISGLDELEEWVVEEGSMPCLHTLSIWNCKKLKELPEGVKYITSLKELTITYMKKEWKEKLESGGESYYKVQHIPTVKLRYSGDN